MQIGCNTGNSCDEKRDHYTDFYGRYFLFQYMYFPIVRGRPALQFRTVEYCKYIEQYMQDFETIKNSGAFAVLSRNSQHPRIQQFWAEIEGSIDIANGHVHVKINALGFFLV